MFEVFSAPSTSKPGDSAIHRTVPLPQPLLTKYIRMEVVEAAENVRFNMDFVGAVKDKVYSLEKNMEITRVNTGTKFDCGSLCFSRHSFHNNNSTNG